jgi:N-acetylmuramoyl-L-alanine amidase
VKRLIGFVALIAALAFGGCSTSDQRRRFAYSETVRQSAAPSAVNLKQMLVPKGRYGRRKEFGMRPTYITIHSTGNRGAGAYQHARGMASGAFKGRSKWNRTGYLTWHFSVDDRVAIQSLPLNIQGEHADHDGPGNNKSIAIEICEFRSNSQQARAVDRAARLTAWLMREKGIPLSHVVPHYHWPQRHFHNYKKNCPRILFTNGRPGPKWDAFLRQVQRYY